MARHGGFGNSKLLGYLFHLDTFQIMSRQTVALTLGQPVSYGARQDPLHPLTFVPVGRAAVIKLKRDRIAVLIAKINALTLHSQILRHVF